ncbi:hypothetical protein A3Q56_02987 [Intoshia linei]|uniref:Uncharacterized protein n=1 Tax=Intoshia linei TaxID=1819745 RepID=A0A177B6J1_9BILA|nr:hypothetical protein A3Q56_02987 [Intoshia linei]
MTEKNPVVNNGYVDNKSSKNSRFEVIQKEGDEDSHTSSMFSYATYNGNPNYPSTNAKKKISKHDEISASRSVSSYSNSNSRSNSNSNSRSGSDSDSDSRSKSYCETGPNKNTALMSSSDSNSESYSESGSDSSKSISKHSKAKSKKKKNKKSIKKSRSKSYSSYSLSYSSSDTSTELPFTESSSCSESSVESAKKKSILSKKKTKKKTKTVKNLIDLSTMTLSQVNKALGQLTLSLTKPDDIIGQYILQSNVEKRDILKLARIDGRSSLLLKYYNSDFKYLKNLNKKQTSIKSTDEYNETKKKMILDWLESKVQAIKNEELEKARKAGKLPLIKHLTMVETNVTPPKSTKNLIIENSIINRTGYVVRQSPNYYPKYQTIPPQSFHSKPITYMNYTRQNMENMHPNMAYQNLLNDTNFSKGKKENDDVMKKNEVEYLKKIKEIEKDHENVKKNKHKTEKKHGHSTDDSYSTDETKFQESKKNANKIAQGKIKVQKKIKKLNSIQKIKEIEKSIFKLNKQVQKEKESKTTQIHSSNQHELQPIEINQHQHDSPSNCVSRKRQKQNLKTETFKKLKNEDIQAPQKTDDIKKVNVILSKNTANIENKNVKEPTIIEVIDNSKELSEEAYTVEQNKNNLMETDHYGKGDIINEKTDNIENELTEINKCQNEPSLSPITKKNKKINDNEEKNKIKDKKKIKYEPIPITITPIEPEIVKITKESRNLPPPVMEDSLISDGNEPTSVKLLEKEKSKKERKLLKSKIIKMEKASESENLVEHVDISKKVKKNKDKKSSKKSDKSKKSKSSKSSKSSKLKVQRNDKDNKDDNVNEKGVQIETTQTIETKLNKNLKKNIASIDDQIQMKKIEKSEPFAKSTISEKSDESEKFQKIEKSEISEKKLRKLEKSERRKKKKEKKQREKEKVKEEKKKKNGKDKLKSHKDKHEKTKSKGDKIKKHKKTKKPKKIDLPIMNLETDMDITMHSDKHTKINFNSIDLDAPFESEKRRLKNENRESLKIVLPKPKVDISTIALMYQKNKEAKSIITNLPKLMTGSMTKKRKLDEIIDSKNESTKKLKLSNGSVKKQDITPALSEKENLINEDIELKKLKKETASKQNDYDIISQYSNSFSESNSNNSSYLKDSEILENSHAKPETLKKLATTFGTESNGCMILSDENQKIPENVNFDQNANFILLCQLKTHEHLMMLVKYFEDLEIMAKELKETVNIEKLHKIISQELTAAATASSLSLEITQECSKLSCQNTFKKTKSRSIKISKNSHLKKNVKPQTKKKIVLLQKNDKINETLNNETLEIPEIEKIGKEKNLYSEKSDNIKKQDENEKMVKDTFKINIEQEKNSLKPKINQKEKTIYEKGLLEENSTVFKNLYSNNIQLRAKAHVDMMKSLMDRNSHEIKLKAFLIGKGIDPALYNPKYTFSANMRQCYNPNTIQPNYNYTPFVKNHNFAPYTSQIQKKPIAYDYIVKDFERIARIENNKKNNLKRTQNSKKHVDNIVKDSFDNLNTNSNVNLNKNVEKVNNDDSGCSLTIENEKVQKENVNNVEIVKEIIQNETDREPECIPEPETYETIHDEQKAETPDITKIINEEKSQVKTNNIQIAKDEQEKSTTNVPYVENVVMPITEDGEESIILIYRTEDENSQDVKPCPNHDDDISANEEAIVLSSD